mgnify:FL=1
MDSWILFEEQKPANGQRCLVCYKPWEMVIILTYNEKFECWDDEEGDDYFCDFTEVDFWRSLPYYRSCD